MNRFAGVLPLHQIEGFRDNKRWRFHNPIIEISEVASSLFNSLVEEMSVISLNVSPAVKIKLALICNNIV